MELFEKNQFILLKYLMRESFIPLRLQGRL